MDPEMSRFSPGSLVLNYAIRDAIGEGASAWEFLRGVEDYKFLWGAERVPKSRLLLWHAKEQSLDKERWLAFVE
jgi:CelD/BcsL family acetyltransferase involved in cellulose biosynthesis